MLKITGIDEMQRKLRDLERKAQELDGKEIPMSELLTPAFLRGCTRFSSFQELCSASGFKVSSKEDFEAIPDLEWDAFIARESRFATWKEMLHSAGGAYTRRLLGFDRS